MLLIEIRDRSYGQQQTPAAGCRPASDQAPLRQAMSTTCRIVPATLPQRGTRRTPVKTSVSVFETLFLVPSSLRRRSGGRETSRAERACSAWQSIAGLGEAMPMTLAPSVPGRTTWLPLPCCYSCMVAPTMQYGRAGRGAGGGIRGHRRRQAVQEHREPAPHGLCATQARRDGDPGDGVRTSRCGGGGGRPSSRRCGRGTGGARTGAARTRGGGRK